MKSRSRKLSAMAVGLGLIALCAAAAAPSDSDHAKPDRQRSNRPDGQARPSGSWREHAATTKPSAEEWEDVDAFMDENSPKRWAKFRDMPEGRREKLKPFFNQRYRMLQDLKQNDSAMYDVRIKRLKIEDDIFSLGWDLKNTRSDASADSTRAELKKRVRALADSRIEEHRLRFKQLQERLEQERTRIAVETAGVDQFVKNGMDALESDMRWPMGDLVIPMPVRGGSGNPGRETYLAPATQSTSPKK